MQRDLLNRCRKDPNLLFRMTNEGVFLKHIQTFEKVTLQSPASLKQLRLHSGAVVVHLDVDSTLRTSHFLSKLVGDLKQFCFAPHDGLDILLHPFSPNLLYLVKSLLETGRCVINSDPEQDELESLLDALGMDSIRLQLFTELSMPAKAIYRQEEGSCDDVIICDSDDDAVKVEMDNHDPTEDGNHTPGDFDSATPEALGHKRKLAEIETKCTSEKRRCVVNGSYFNSTFKKSNCQENHDQVQVDDNVKTKQGINEDIFVERDDFSGGFDDKDRDMTEREPVDSPVGLNVGDMAYAMHQNDQQEFKKCKIIGKEINADGSTYQIRFEGSHMKSRTSWTTSTLAGTQLAYFDPTKSKLSEGTRCIAIFCEEPDDPGRFFAGIVAESPNDFNDNHYLIFFDDGYKAYLPLEDVREMVETLTEVWKDGPCDPEFIQNYLEQFPSNPVLHLSVDELVETYLREDKVWVMARVLEVDASLVKMDFGEDYEPEWMYVGSPRFKLLFDNYNLKKEVIDDPSAMADIAYGEPPKTKKRIRTLRKCTGRGGKVPRQEIKNKPLRKTLNSQSKMLNEELNLEDDHF